MGTASMEIPTHGLQPAQPRAEIEQPPGDQMHYLAFPLHLPEHTQEA